MFRLANESVSGAEPIARNSRLRRIRPKYKHWKTWRESYLVQFSPFLLLTSIAQPISPFDLVYPVSPIAPGIDKKVERLGYSTSPQPDPLAQDSRQPLETGRQR